MVVVERVVPVLKHDAVSPREDAVVHHRTLASLLSNGNLGVVGKASISAVLIQYMLLKLSSNHEHF